MKTRHSAVLLVWVILIIGGCVTFDATPDPNFGNLEPERLASLKGGQVVALKNGYPSEDKVSFKSGTRTYVFDQQQFTEAAIANLRRALEKQGIKIDAAVDKAITLRVRIQKFEVQVNGIIVTAFARAGLDASFAADGDVYVEGANPNPRIAQSSVAMQAAVQVALRALVADPKFIAYVNR